MLACAGMTRPEYAAHLASTPAGAVVVAGDEDAAGRAA